VSAYHTPAEGPTVPPSMPRSETIHGALAGRPMLRWRLHTSKIRGEMAATMAGAIACAKQLTMRRPTNADVTGDYEIGVEEREAVHAIIDAAYNTLYDALEAMQVARDSVELALERLGYIPIEWTRADTICWSERPEMWGCTEEDVARVDRIRANGIFHTPAQEPTP
jgi:hypothetical protein